MRLLLIDVSAIIYASWYAKDALITKSGKDVRVFDGLIAKVYRLLQEFESDKFIFVIDPPEGSLYRKAMFPEYKKNRPIMPEDFLVQKKLIPSFFTHLGWPFVMINGVESDDVIASLTQEWTSHSNDNEVLIVSHDKDLLQLVSEKVFFLRLLKSNKYLEKGSFEMLTKEGVLNEFGVYPEQIVDLLVMIGDSADNIPGIKGIGIKKGSALLQKYGSIEIIMSLRNSFDNKTKQAFDEKADLIDTLKSLNQLQKNVSCLNKVQMKKTSNKEIDFLEYLDKEKIESISKIIKSE